VKNSSALWVIAGVLVTQLLLIISCAGVFAVRSANEYQRREDLLRREPWRHTIREPEKYNPYYRGR